MIALAVAGSLAIAAPVFAGKLSIVIDDFGYRPQTENKVLALPPTISVAVLPNAPTPGKWPLKRIIWATKC